MRYPVAQLSYLLKVGVHPRAQKMSWHGGFCARKYVL